MPSSFIDSIYDVGIVLAKAETQDYKRARDATKAIVTILEVLVMRDMLHLLVAVACGYENRV